MFLPPVSNFKAEDHEARCKEHLHQSVSSSFQSNDRKEGRVRGREGEKKEGYIERQKEKDRMKSEEETKDMAKNFLNVHISIFGLL